MEILRWPNDTIGPAACLSMLRLFGWHCQGAGLWITHDDREADGSEAEQYAQSLWRATVGLTRGLEVREGRL